MKLILFVNFVEVEQIKNCKKIICSFFVQFTQKWLFEKLSTILLVRISKRTINLCYQNSYPHIIFLKHKNVHACVLSWFLNYQFVLLKKLSTGEKNSKFLKLSKSV